MAQRCRSHPIPVSSSLMSDTAPWAGQGWAIKCSEWPSWVIHRLEVDIVQPQRSLQHLGLCVWSFRGQRPWNSTADLETGETAWLVNVCHVNTEKQQEMITETSFWSCGWHYHPHGLGPILFPVAIFLAVLSCAPRACQSHLLPPHQLWSCFFWR